MKAPLKTLLYVLGAVAGLVLVIGVTWVLAAPSEEDPDESTSSVEPDRTPSESPDHKLVVQILDAIPMGYYFPSNGPKCDIGSRMFMLREQATVTVRDKAGEILAVELAPVRGGEFQERAGCAVAVEVAVPTRDFYEVEISGGTHVKGDPPREPITKTVELGSYLQDVIFDV